MAGIVGALAVALALRGTITKGKASGFIMEMPRYQWPRPRDLALGLLQRAWIFLRRAGTIILQVNVVLWLLLNFPQAERARIRWMPRSRGTSPMGWRWW
jgi:ferrous iron transport protein B